MIKTYYYSHEQQAVLHDVDLSQLDQLLASKESLLWIDLYDCAASELHYIGDLFKFHPWPWKTVYSRARGPSWTATMIIISSFSMACAILKRLRKRTR